MFYSYFSHAGVNTYCVAIMWLYRIMHCTLCIFMILYSMDWPAPPTCHVIVSGLPHAIELLDYKSVDTNLAGAFWTIFRLGCPWLTERAARQRGTRTRLGIMALCPRRSTWPSLSTGTTTYWSYSIHWVWPGAPVSTYSGKRSHPFFLVVVYGGLLEPPWKKHL